MSGPLFYYLCFTAIFLLASWAIYVPYRMGQLHFLAVANMLISAYFAAILSGAAVSGTLVPGSHSTGFGLHWPFAAVLLAATLLSALIGYLVSLAIGDAPCFAVVIVGFTFMYLFKTIVENTGALGRTMGMFNVPRIINSTQGNRIFLALVIYAIVILTGYLIRRFDKSSLGRAASVIFTDRDLAVSLGIDIKKTGILLQTFSSALGGLAGVLYLYVTRSISPAFITFRNLGLFMTILFVGGYTTPWGALLAAPVLWGLPLILPEALQPWKNVFYAFMLIFIILIKPEGIITRPILRRISRRVKKVRRKTAWSKE
ncbi:branched-chain amino acid ABC transporter permease [Spirochaetia bacterium]|nr:branched-chain amino acid ABC transporter permease [Spirochaetia bacterium]